jgi:hypothetical protein
MAKRLRIRFVIYATIKNRDDVIKRQALSAFAPRALYAGPLSSLQRSEVFPVTI